MSSAKEVWDTMPLPERMKNFPDFGLACVARWSELEHDEMKAVFDFKKSQSFQAGDGK
jgi:hypothetical protein